MNRLLAWLALLLFCGAQAQEQTAEFDYRSIALDRLLPEVEQVFNVQYSYLDSIVAPHRVTLAFRKYTLAEINSAIESQTMLKIARLDDRYFSVYNQAEPIQVQWLQEILVENLLAKGIDKKAAAVLLSPQKIEILPGVTDADVLLSLQQLPGVKSPNETATGLHIRGGTPDQNLILWDGIRMYHPGHLFGMVSGFNPNVRQTVQYYNKATDARYGERVSGTIDIKTQDKISQKSTIDAGFNGLNADACVQLPLLRDKLDLQVSGRKSYTQWWPSPTFDALADKVFQHTDFAHFDDVNRFAFEDYSAKINFRPFDQTSIGLSGILIDNALDFTASDVNIIGQQLDIRNLGYSVAWEQKYGQRFRQRVLWQYSAYRFAYLKKRHFASDDYESFEKKNRVTDSGLSVDFNYDLSGKLQWSFGYQLSGYDLSHAFTAENEGFSVDLGQKQAYAKVHSGYVQGEYALGKWQFLGGVRISRYSQSVQAVEPRAMVQRKMGKSLVWQSSYERKSQMLSQVRENVSNDLSLENYVWVLADGAPYPLQYAGQFTTGLLFKPGNWLIDADAYYKTISGITSHAFGWMQQYNAAVLRGEGSTKGFDLLVQKNLADWRAWLTYAYQDSQNKFASVNEGQRFPTSTDISHAVGISVFRKWQRFSATAGWFWHSGKPYSRLNAGGQIASYNADRLPAYHRLDLSALYVFRKTDKCNAKIGVSVTNVYNRRSVLSKEYERNFANFSDLFSSRYTAQDYYSLGLLPNIFVRVSF